MWVFGYGSLMWDGWETQFGAARRERATLHGARRDFNKASLRNWGSRQVPAPTLGLVVEPNANCVGFAFEFADVDRDRILATLRDREGKSFSLDEKQITLDSGDIVNAIVPINDPSRSTFIGDQPIEARARLARAAVGSKGSGLSYVRNIRQKLHDVGIDDRGVEEFWEQVVARNAAGAARSSPPGEDSHAMTTRPNAAALRSQIEKALDEIISNEEGMSFQGLAVVLARQRWPELIASERKNDLGLDAYASASVSPDEIGKGLASSITAELSKITDDAKKVKQHFSDVSVLLFYTPQKVSNPKKKEWAEKTQKDFGYELHVMSREDIIISLMEPRNASVCSSFLAIDVETDEASSGVIDRIVEAAAAEAATWTAGTPGPLISLRAARIDDAGNDTSDLYTLANTLDALDEGRRLVLEAPAGRGKTTTLAQLAEMEKGVHGVPFLVDLPAWISSGRSILEFIAQSPQFQARGLDAAALARVKDSVHFSFLLNGWNEIEVLDSVRAGECLRTLDRSFTSAGIIVATRTHHVRPPLPGARRLRLLQLTRRQRNDYLRQRLGDRAGDLVRQLDTGLTLDELTRTPLVLSGVVSIFLAGESIPKTKMGVLDTVVRLMENAPEHAVHLASPPLGGLAHLYQSSLAAQMTARGAVSVPDADARLIVHAVSQSLYDTHQITVVPAPADVLTALCAHHVLERLEYPTLAFRFTHQQFQELYAAGDIKRQLLRVAASALDGERRDFTAAYVNQPAWAEPLRMIAQTIGIQVDDATADQREVQAGRALVEMAAAVDLVFAAELAGVCGPHVWRAAGPALSGRLRSWHAAPNESHRNCALAAMLATGSDDFTDTLIPLLSSDDQQIRLATYRLWPDMGLSSLGPDWRKELASWSEDARADFVGEMLFHRFDADLADFAATDASPKVKQSAVTGLSWRGSDDALTQVLESMDPQTFDAAASGSAGERLPESLHPRVLDSLRRAYEASSDPSVRLRMLMHMAELDEADLDGRIKESLDALPPKELHNLSHLVRAALDALRQHDPGWVSQWVAKHLAGYSLWSSEYWMPYVVGLPAGLVEEHLQRIESEHVKYRNLEGLAALLTAYGNTGLASELFSKIRELRRPIDSKPAEPWEHERETLRQLETLFRALLGDVAAVGILSVVSDPNDLRDLNLAANLVSRALRHDELPFEVIDESVRERLRAYLKAGVAILLPVDGPDREPLAKLAAAIAEVGKPEDMTDVVTLVRADIERRNAGRDAMSYSNYYVPAIMKLDSENGEKVLIDLLRVPEYTHVVGQEMSRPFLVKPARAFDRSLQYDLMWAVREGKAQAPADNDRRLRYAAALRDEMARLIEERANTKEPGPVTYRLKEFARDLAGIDGRGSTDVILQVLALPSQWDESRRVETAERLLLCGAVLPIELTFAIVDGAAEKMKNYGAQNGNDWVLRRALCLCPFIDDPAKGIQKIRDALATRMLAPYQLPDIVIALGESRCETAVDLLRELASSPDAFKEFADIWPGALAKIGTASAHELLLSFVDPDVPGLAPEARIDRDDALVWRIAELAKKDARVETRLRELSDRDLPSHKRHVLSRVLSRIQTVEALLANLNLIDDRLPSPMPRGTWEQVEAAFVQRRPSDQMENAFTLEASAANDVRARLFDMAAHDPRRRRAAFALLGQIEEWRLEYGRPTGEPRHPAFGSTDPWPPVEPPA
jgi:cation transport regulator ChaC